MFSRIDSDSATRFFGAVTGDQPDAGFHCGYGRGQVRRFAVQQDVAGKCFRAEQRAADCFLPRAAQADKAEQLAFAQFK